MKKEREKTKGNENIDVTTRGIAANALNKGGSEKGAVEKKWTGYKKIPASTGPVGTDMCVMKKLFFFGVDSLPKYCCDSTTYQRTNDEDPEVCQCCATLEERRTDRTCGVN